MATLTSQLLSISLLLGTLHLIKGANVTDVRLSNTTNGGRSGVLEIEVDGTTWGVVCDDLWDTNQYNAIIACKHLGLTNGGTAELSNKYGQGNGTFLLDDTNCKADMATLSQCLSSQSSDCTLTGDKVVGLDCNAIAGPGVTTFKPPTTTKISTGVISDNCQSTNPTVRLFGNLNSTVQGAGLVVVQNPTTLTWGYVCDDGWDQNAAKVVCAQLCFPTNYTAKPGVPSEHRVTPENPQIILDGVVCTGTESTLQECTHGTFGTTDCSAAQGEFAGVQCVEANNQAPAAPNPVVACNDGVLRVDFYRSRDRELKETHLTVPVTDNTTTCADVTKSTSTDFITVSIPVNKCETTVSRNTTHIIYDNTIMYAPTTQEGGITRVNTYRVAIKCAYPITKVVTQRIQPMTESVTKNSVGVIVSNMKIYDSDSFTNPVTTNPVQIPLGEYLNLAVTMEEYDTRLKLVVTDCVATPNGVANQGLSKVLFKDKCVVEPSLSVYPISNFVFGFRFKPFKFVGYPLLYIQCDSIICLKSDVTNECDRSCNNTKPTSAAATTGKRRKRRSNSVLQREELLSPAIVLYDPHEVDSENPIKVVIDVSDGNELTTKKTDATLPKTDGVGVKTTMVPSVTQFKGQTPPVTDKSGDNTLVVKLEGDETSQTQDNVGEGQNGNLSANDDNNSSDRLHGLSFLYILLALCLFQCSYCVL